MIEVFAAALGIIVSIPATGYALAYAFKAGE